ncbi:MAG: isoprenyl transferase [Clostridiales bacterium]|nr:isoprenyl transferase [Clostridiales bacterium]
MQFFKGMRRRVADIGHIDPENIPRHIAIIMDGNGRWAKKRGMPRNAGHRAGADNLKRIVRYCDAMGVKYLTVYAFSTENWNRPQEEVNGIMELLLQFLRNAEKEIGGDNIRILVIGEKTGLSDEILKEIERVEGVTSRNDGLTLLIALNYGGRSEITGAVRKIAEKVRAGILEPDDINEELLNDSLYTAGIPDPDLLIRPSGESRISNFLLWQSSYSEFWFSNVLWPDFSKSDLKSAIIEYQKRNRRFGGV